MADDQGGCVELDVGRKHPYLSGNFAPIQQTRRLTACAYEGTIPDDLAGGQYVRNGGNPVTNSDLGRDAHWFDGDGMLSGVLFRRLGLEGVKKARIRPEFVCQHLVTDVFAYAQQSAQTLRRPVLPSIATLVNPLASLLAVISVILRTVTLVLLSRVPGSTRPIRKISVANTAVLYHDGRALATCESGPPLRFALPGLETIGWFGGRGAENETGRPAKPGFGGSGIVSFMKEWTTAHPRVDPVTGELIAFHATFVAPFVHYSVVPPAKTRQLLPPARFDRPVPGVAAPKMMHDFGVSRYHTVIMDLPLSLDPLNLVRGVPVLSYDARGTSRFGVFPRHRPDAVQWFETSPCCIFHTANCWDSSPPQPCVHLLACRLTSASLVFSAGNLPAPACKPVPPEYAEDEQCRLYYYNFPLSAVAAAPSSASCPSPPLLISHQWALSAISFEFPTVSPLVAMRPARFVYGCSSRSGSYTVALGKAAKIDVLAKLDVAALIARGLRSPPHPVLGCVDTRTVSEMLSSANPPDDDDPIRLFALPPAWYAQEPRFVPRSRAPDCDDAPIRREDDGYLLTYVFDESQLDDGGTCPPDAVSELWVIDARTMRDVLCRVRLPQRVPYGLHGAWFSENDMAEQRPYLRTREALTSIPIALRGGGEGVWMELRRVVERWIG